MGRKSRSKSGHSAYCRSVHGLDGRCVCRPVEGVVARPTLALVGEPGPESVVPVDPGGRRAAGL